ncbi:hypothetical protein HYH02_015277 [Chlamydomonas schloesseri]|uniref:Uncharacterized protein n=1 Tax=Chlamydomonas schloesseri TaxID=2026947 RepID=A0A835SK28_9CHLO|nr:hypothetical protein HYH02_015277 [Chlamydomonas schloesseri]|eukprot:KAG2423799.1 hypothetical protein HYH02_015277 [Chlamydomonas schloesseri]
MGARVAHRLSTGVAAVLPTVQQHPNLANRIAIYDVYGSARCLTSLDPDNYGEYLFTFKDDVMVALIDLQPTTWQADGRKCFHLPSCKVYMVPCTALSTAAILLSVSGGANLFSTMLYPETKRCRVSLTDAAVEQQYQMNPGAGDEWWEQQGAHLGMAAGLALCGQAGAGMSPNFVGTDPKHPLRAQQATQRALQASHAPGPLPMPDLQLHLGEAVPVLDAAAVTATAEVAMYEDLDDLLFPAPSPKRARGGGP